MFPDLIRIRILADGKPLQGAVACLHLPMRVKNAFNFIAGPTDSEGRCKVSRDQLLAQAKADRDFFLMDYGDPEGQNLEHITVTPMTRDTVARAISAYEMYHPSYPFPAGYIAALKAADQILAAMNPRKLECEAEAAGGQIAVNSTSAPP